MEIELESGEETKVPTVAEARARFDQAEGVPPHKISRAEIQPKGPPMVPLAPKPKEPVPKFIPKKVVPPVKKPVPKPVVRPDVAAQEGVKSPSPRLLLYLYSMACMHDTNDCINTVNFLNIRTPQKIVVITLKFELYGSTIE